MPVAGGGGPASPESLPDPGPAPPEGGPAPAPPEEGVAPMPQVHEEPGLGETADGEDPPAWMDALMTFTGPTGSV